MWSSQNAVFEDSCEQHYTFWEVLFRRSCVLPHKLTICVVSSLASFEHVLLCFHLCLHEIEFGLKRDVLPQKTQIFPCILWQQRTFVWMATWNIAFLSGTLPYTDFVSRKKNTSGLRKNHIENCFKEKKWGLSSRTPKF